MNAPALAVNIREVHIMDPVVEAGGIALYNRVAEVAQTKGVENYSQLSKHAGLHPSAVRRIWNKEVKQLSLETILRLTEALDASFEELFPRVELPDTE
jgi:DNA-binding Xre family transcriptional regulator